jgi:hypothetical protein
MAALAVAAWQVIGQSDSATKAASGSRRLAPPPAIGDVITKTAVVGGSVPNAPANAVMVGRTSGVKLVKYGFVSSYGASGSAHSAPVGRRLLAFVAQPVAGEEAADPPDLSVLVNGEKRGPLVVTSDYVVIAVPTAPTDVDLLLDDSGVTQSLSLLTGSPSSANPIVCARKHRSAAVNVTKNVTVRVKSGSSPVGMTSGTLTVSGVSLSYWGQNGHHASNPEFAFLHIAATVKLAGDKQAYGADAGLLTVAVGGDAPLRAHNAAADTTSEVDNVVEVPATTTSGLIRYSGTVTTSRGSIEVSTPVSVSFTIPAG